MRRTSRWTLTLAAAAIAIPAMAATEKQLSPQATAVLPPLTRTVEVQATDSALVQAAKRMVAERLRGRSSGWVIDNQNLARSGGRFAVANENEVDLGGYSPASVVPMETPSAAAPSSGPSRAKLEQTRQELQQTLGRAAQEADQPYGDSVDEDLVRRQMTEIPGQIKELDRSLQRP